MSDQPGGDAAGLPTAGELAELVVARVGGLVATGRVVTAYRLLDPAGARWAR